MAGEMLADDARIGVVAARRFGADEEIDLLAFIKTLDGLGVVFALGHLLGGGSSCGEAKGNAG